MSTRGGWEIVSSKKNKEKTNGKAAKLTKTEKKDFLANAPRLEDILPLNDVRSIYHHLDNNNEDNKPPKKPENKSTENRDKKKPKKQKPKEQSQPKVQAKNVSEKQQVQQMIDDFDKLLADDRAKFPNAPVIWLKDLASFLDTRVPPQKDDPGFQSKADTYPLDLLPNLMRSTLEKAIKLAGYENVVVSWESILTTMIRNMSNNSPDIGCKIFLQLLAQMHPEVTLQNIPKLLSLRNSYQNNKNIGMSLLWAFSQCGKNNFTSGLTIWHEVMAPMIESRSYAAYVTKILKDLLFLPKSSNFHLTKELYLNIIDDFYSGKYNVSSTIEKEIRPCMDQLRIQMVKSQTIQLPLMFEILMSKITLKTSANYRDEILKSLISCIDADVRCLSTWTSSHQKHLYQSDLLLKQIVADWDTLSVKVKSQIFENTSQVFCALNVGTKKGKEATLLLSCQKTALRLREKMSVASKKDSSFPWKKGSLALILLIGAVVAFDCQKHGSYEASNTGKFLKASGLNQHASNAWSLVTVYKDKSLGYLEASSPEYYKAAADLSNKYSKLAGDLWLVSRNIAVKLYLNTVRYVRETKPVVTESFEHYFPGLLDALHKRSLIEIERVKTYSAIAGEHVVKQSTAFVRWLETSVFVGNLSPDNLRGYASQAIESTQSLATQTYDWLYEKVQTLSKVQ